MKLKLILIVFVGFWLAKPVVAQTICIDPGHPSEIGNGTSSKYISELEANWRIAVKLKSELLGYHYQVVLTKANINQFVANRDRAMVANRVEADLLVRLHCDGNSGSGLTIYYPAKPGTINGFTGPDKQTIADSRHYAKTMTPALRETLAGYLTVNPVKTDRQTAVGAKHGALIGSIYSEVPVVLIEMCNLKNDRDARFIASEQGQWIVAQSIAKAIGACFW